MILGNPPHQTPAVNPRAYFQQPWASWFSTLKALFDSLTTTAAGALQASKNLSDVASSPAALTNLLGAWQTWTPAVTCDAGMTISGLAVTAAQFLKLGPAILFSVNLSFVLGGTAATRVFITLPVTPADNQAAFALYTGASSANTSIVGRSDTTNQSLFRPNPSANWTLGTQVFMATGFYRV